MDCIHNELHELNLLTTSLCSIEKSKCIQESIGNNIDGSTIYDSDDSDAEELLNMTYFKVKQQPKPMAVRRSPRKKRKTTTIAQLLYRHCQTTRQGQGRE